MQVIRTACVTTPHGSIASRAERVRITSNAALSSAATELAEHVPAGPDGRRAAPACPSRRCRTAAAGSPIICGTPG